MHCIMEAALYQLHDARIRLAINITLILFHDSCNVTSFYFESHDSHVSCDVDYDSVYLLFSQVCWGTLRIIFGETRSVNFTKLFSIDKFYCFHSNRCTCVTPNLTPPTAPAGHTRHPYLPKWKHISYWSPDGRLNGIYLESHHCTEEAIALNSPERAFTGEFTETSYMTDITISECHKLQQIWKENCTTVLQLK